MKNGTTRDKIVAWYRKHDFVFAAENVDEILGYWRGKETELLDVLHKFKKPRRRK